MNRFPVLYPMKSWLAKQWLGLYGEDHPAPRWVKNVLARNQSLRSEWESDRALTQKLQESAKDFLEQTDDSDKPANLGEFRDPLGERSVGPRSNVEPSNSVVRAEGNTEHREHRNTATFWMIAASVMLAIGVGYFAWGSFPWKPKKNEDNSGILAMNQPQDTESFDLKPLLATAQAGQVVYSQIADATQTAARNSLRLTSEAQVGNASLDSSLNQAGEASIRVANGVMKVFSIFADGNDSSEAQSTKES